MSSELAVPDNMPDPNHGHGSAGSLLWLMTIRARLYMAFGFAAVITVIGSLIALLEFTSIGGTTTEILSHSMPATVQSLRLSEEASGLVTSAPRLMAVTDEGHRATVAAEITEQSRKLAGRIERLRTLDSNRSLEFEAAQAAMVERLAALNSAVTERIIVSKQRQTMALSIRKAREELLERIIPLIDDTNFELMMANKDANRVPNELLDSLRRLLEVQAEVNLLAGLLTEASMVTERARLEPIRDLVESAQRKIEANLKALANPEQRKTLTALYDRLAVMAGKDGIVILRGRELNSQRETELAYLATQSEAVKLKQAVDRLVEQQDQAARATAEHAQQQIRSGRALLIALAAAALLLALVSGYFLLPAIVRPLWRLLAIMDVVRQGDLTQRMDAKRRDEFGTLADGFNRMADEMKLLFGNVQKSSNQVSTSMAEIAATSKQQEATASEIAATTTEVGATSKEISATSKELVKTMNEVSRVAEHTATLASDGQTGLNRMEERMRQVMEAASSINAKLAVLNEKAGRINQVVTTITKVADQTNLLSLNAAIEAEKAGEYGRGFAVVASEIRRLADQTAVATHDIDQIVKEIQSAVTAGVMCTDKFAEEVRHGMHEIQQVGGQLSQIIQHVQALAPRVETVNEGMQAQATGAEQISDSLLQLVGAAQQTVESLRQSTTAIDELNQVSRDLRNSVSRFKLEAA
jgi:methyl-accepting chemotaxis protein WspA